MATPADRQVEANEDVERIAREVTDTLLRAFFGGGHPDADEIDDRHITWRALAPDQKDATRGAVRELLLRDVIRVGHRPQKGRDPMRGQTQFEEGGP